MKKVVITAFNGTGKDKVLAGERTVDMPETVDEAKAKFGEEDTLDYIVSAFTIEQQRQIRAGTTMSDRQKMRELEAYMKANPDSEVTKTLQALKITLKKASDASTENPQ